jgi:hypothetical protein
VESYYSQSLQNFPRISLSKDKNELAARLLEVLEIQCSEDGELYARQLKALLGVIDNPPSGGSYPVLETVVEVILHYIQAGEYLHFRFVETLSP